MDSPGSTVPLWSATGTTPLQKPRYKFDINLNFVEETCQRPPDYYDKCNSKPCTRCTPEQKCTEPTKRKIDPTKCVYKKHYILEPSLYGFDGDPWYGWSTIGEKRPKGEEGPYSMVTMQPNGYPNASVIVLLNDTKPHNFAPPTALSGLERLNKFPNQRGVLLPDCPARDKQQKECTTIGCPSFVTPGTFNPETGRYTPKSYFPPHFHDMHRFLGQKALETGAKDLGYTYDTCYKYPDGIDFEGKAQRDVFGFCQEGPCGHPHKYKDIGKCQYIDCPAKTVCAPSEHEAEAESDDFIIEGEQDETDVRPGQVVIEHGISRQSCCFEGSVSSLSDMENGSLQSASIDYGRSDDTYGKGGRRISWDEELGEQESEDSVNRHFRTLLFAIALEKKRERQQLAMQSDEYVPHRRCTWKGTMHDVDDSMYDPEEAAHVSGDILNELLNRGSAREDTPEPDEDEAGTVSKGILDGLLDLKPVSHIRNDFESHEPEPQRKTKSKAESFKYSKDSRQSSRKKLGSKERDSARTTRMSKKGSRGTQMGGKASGSDSGTDSRSRSRNKSKNSAQSKESKRSSSKKDTKKTTKLSNIIKFF